MFLRVYPLIRIILNEAVKPDLQREKVLQNFATKYLTRKILANVFVDLTTSDCKAWRRDKTIRLMIGC